MNNKVLVIAGVVVGIICGIIAFVYVTQGHFKHAIAFVLLALGAFSFSWFKSAPKKK